MLLSTQPPSFHRKRMTMREPAVWSTYPKKLYVSLTCARCRVQQAKGIHMSPGYKLSRTSVVIVWPASTLLNQWWRDNYHYFFYCLMILNHHQASSNKFCPEMRTDLVVVVGVQPQCRHAKQPLVKRQLSPCTKQFQPLHRTSRVTG